MNDILLHYDIALPPGLLRSVVEVVSVQTVWMFLVALLAGVVLAYTPFGQKVYATGGNIRAAAYAGINTDQVRFLSLLFAALCASMAGSSTSPTSAASTRSPASSASSTPSPR